MQTCLCLSYSVIRPGYSGVFFGVSMEVSRCIYSRYKVPPTDEHIMVAKKVVDYFGSQGKTAKALNWTRNYVYGWVSGRYHLPVDRAEQVQEVTQNKFTVLEIRPDLKHLEKYFQKPVAKE